MTIKCIVCNAAPPTDPATWHRIVRRSVRYYVQTRSAVAHGALCEKCLDTWRQADAKEAAIQAERDRIAATTQENFVVPPRPMRTWEQIFAANVYAVAEHIRAKGSSGGIWSPGLWRGGHVRRSSSLDDSD